MSHGLSRIGGSRVSLVTGTHRSITDLGEDPIAACPYRSTPRAGLSSTGVDLLINGAGRDPCDTMHLIMRRMDLYEFHADYRNLNCHSYSSYAVELDRAGVARVSQEDFGSARRRGEDS